jgi:peptide deformylase
LTYPLSKDAAKVIKKKSWGAPGASWTPGVDHLED